jgi:hypothetical protein
MCTQQRLPEGEQMGHLLLGLLLQEVAGNHAVGMWGRTDNGFANLPSMKDLIFVMTRLQIRMLSYPKWWVSRGHAVG